MIFLGMPRKILISPRFVVGPRQYKTITFVHLKPICMQHELHPTPARWSFGKKLAFLFFLLFFPLYIFFNPNGIVPFSEYVFDYYIEPFHKLIPWIAKHILHLSKDITVFTNGSGDTTYDYVVVLVIFVLSIAGAVIWAVLDRKRESYNQLYHWLTVVVRYYA